MNQQDSSRETLETMFDQMLGMLYSNMVIANGGLKQIPIERSERLALFEGHIDSFERYIVRQVQKAVAEGRIEELENFNLTIYSPDDTLDSYVGYIEKRKKDRLALLRQQVNKNGEG